jgi:hypothetical protein
LHRLPVCVALALLALVSCKATSPKKEKLEVFPASAAVERSGLRIEIVEAKHVSQVKGPFTVEKSERGFVLIETRLTNLRGAPLEEGWNPTLELYSEAGRFAVSTSAFVAANSRNNAATFNTLNPGGSRTRLLPYEAPPGRYMVRVVVPERRSRGLVYGEEFAFDLGEVATESVQ